MPTSHRSHGGTVPAKEVAISDFRRVGQKGLSLVTMKPLSISYRLYVPVAQLLERDPAKVEVGCESHPRDANLCKINAKLRYASRFVR